MKKLIIVRHGESVDNVSHTIQGQRQGKLTDNGLKQAELLGLRLSKEKFDKIFSSDNEVGLLANLLMTGHVR